MSPHEIERRADGSVMERSYLSAPLVLGSTAIGTIAVLACSFHGGLIGILTSGGGGTTVSGPAPPSVYDAPATPSITVLVPLDTSTVRVTISAFNGDQDDTQDSLQVQLDTTGGGFSSPLLDSATAGSQSVDTLQDNAVLAESAVYDVRVRYHGTNGGWSAWSSAVAYTNSIDPAQITTLSVIAQSDTSLTLEWVTVHNGQGQVAFHARRYKNVTGDTASFVWWGVQESSTEVFDSLGTSVGDTVSVEVGGLTANNTYAFGITAYRGEPNVDAVYGPLSNVATGTTTGGGGGGAPQTPVLTLSATADTSNIQMNGSGFNSPGDTHDSTRWILSASSDLTSAFLDSVTATALTSFLYTSNANLTAGVTYYGGLLYHGVAGGWSDTSAIKSVVNAEPGDHPNEPSGMTPITDQPEDAKGSLGWTVGLDQTSTHPNGFKLTIQTDNTAPESCCNVAQHVISAGDNPGGSGGGVHISPNFGGSAYETVYVDYWVKMSSNWWGHPSNTNKINIIKGTVNPGGMNHVLSARGSGDNPLKLEFIEQGGAPGVVQIVRCNQFNELGDTCSSGTIARGSWTRIEWVIYVEGSGGADEVHGYVNGVERIRRTDMTLGSTTSERIATVSTQMIWGGVGGCDGRVGEPDPCPPDQEYSVDNIYISAKQGPP